MLTAVKLKKFYGSMYQKSIALNLFLFFLIGIVVIISRWTSIAVFSNRVGAESLSAIYAIEAIAYFFIAFSIIYGLSKYRVLTFIRVLFFICFLVLFFDSLLFLFLIQQDYFVSVLIITVMWVCSIIEMLMWICAAQFFSSQHAKKIYAYLGGAYALGLLAGSIFLDRFSLKIDPLWYIFSGSVCMLVTCFLVYVLQKKCWHSSYKDDDAVADLDNFFKFILKSSDWLKMIFIAVMLYCLYYISDLQLAVVGDHTYRNVSELTKFFGFFQIINSTVMIIVSYFFIVVISKLGVWNACMLSFFFMAFAFQILGIIGENIYVASLSKILVELFFGLALISIGIVCKNVKQKYQISLITFFDFMPVCLGTLLAGGLGYLLKDKIFSFNFLSLLLAVLSFSIFLWGALTKKTYLTILKEGVEDEQYQLSKGNKQEESIDVRSIDSLQNALARWDHGSQKLKTLSLEVPMKIENVESLKLFLNILEGLQDKDPIIRVKGLVALTKFKSVHGITPFIIKCFDDSDPFVLGQAILTLYEFDPDLTYKNADSVIKTLLNTQSWPYQVLAFEIIHLLKMKKYVFEIAIAMNDLEDKVRKAAYKAYGNLFEIGDENALIELKNNMREQNNEAAKELINAALKIVGDKIDLFTDSILAGDPFLWKNTIELMIRSNHKEDELIIFSGINKLHHVYENLQAIAILLTQPENYYINALLQHLFLQNVVIINGIILILTKDAFDQHIVDAIGKEIRSIVPDVRATALELIENIGDPRLSKHFISYFTLDSDEERIEYGKKVWHIKKNNIQDIFSELLVEDNEWIKACVVHLIGTMQDPYFEKTLEKIIKNDRSLLVIENAKKALMNIHKERDMSNREEKIDFMDMVVFLKSTVLFGEIHLNKLGLIAKFIEQKYYKPEAVIIEEGKKVNGIYILYKGTAVIENLGVEIKNPTVIGGQWMIEDSLSKEWIVAKTEVIALFVSKKVYQNMVTLHPEIAIGLLNELCFNLRRYQEKLEKK